jgi:AcrR family transcriptional regulator
MAQGTGKVFPEAFGRCKERLLDAAAEAFLECGYERCTVADIARRADVTVGAIYSNFQGKSDILLEVMRRRLQQQTDIVRSAVKSTPDINQAFIALSRGRSEQETAQTRVLMLEIFAASRKDPAVRKVVAELTLGMMRFDFAHKGWQSRPYHDKVMP